MHPFEIIISVSAEDIAIELKGHAPISWVDFFLNPRRLRGSDFLMRWSQGVWSEERLVQAVNKSGSYYALPYGPSGTAPDDDPRAFELYFERLEQAGLGGVKRPDLLIFALSSRERVDKLVRGAGGVQELPFTPEDHEALRELLNLAVIAVECENSLWRAKNMPAYGAALTPQRRLGGRPGLRKAAVLPTIIIKEEDRTPLKAWQEQAGVKIHVWHAFYDLAFGISLDRIEELVTEGLIEQTAQTFQAPGGATSKKITYKVYYHYAYPLGESHEEIIPRGLKYEREDGQIFPFVKYTGGAFALTHEALGLLDAASGRT